MIESFVRLEEQPYQPLFFARTWDELAHAAQRRLVGSSLDDFLLKLTVYDGAGTSHGKLVSSLPAGVVGRFGGNRSAEGDPVARQLSRTVVPWQWEIGMVCANAAEELPYHGLRKLGITAGISMSVRSDHSFSRIDFYERGTAQRRKIPADLYLFASYLSEAARILLNKDTPSPLPLLSQREQECLQWSASGKTSGEIALILGISQHTVYFHLKRAASKFNVHGTRHAISRAMELGLIRPI